jgi:hypothetical protein
VSAPFAAALLAVGCSEPVRLGSDPSSDADSDTDSETPTATDSDSDADSDSGTGTGTGSESLSSTDTGSGTDTGSEPDCTPRDRVVGGGGVFCPEGTMTCSADSLCYDAPVCADCCGDPCR